MHPATKSGLHLKWSTCRLGDRRNYSNTNITTYGLYLHHSWTMVIVEQLHFARAVNLRTHHTQVLWRSLTHHGTWFIYSIPLTNFFFEPHVLINGASSGSADKAGHLTHSFKAYSLRKRTTNILINHTPQIFAATTTSAAAEWRAITLSTIPSLHWQKSVLRNTSSGSQLRPRA
jgi:hypothetical protein